MKNDPVLVKLEKQQKEYRDKLKAAKKKIAQREFELRNKRALIIGKAVLTEIEQNREILETIKPIIDKHVKATRDRDMLGFDDITNDNQPPQETTCGEK